MTEQEKLDKIMEDVRDRVLELSPFEAVSILESVKFYVMHIATKVAEEKYKKGVKP